MHYGASREVLSWRVRNTKMTERKSERQRQAVRVDRCIAILEAYSAILRLDRGSLDDQVDPPAFALLTELEILTERVKRAL